MNKIRVIDLLNKIANGEEVPDAIKFNDIIYKKADVGEDYYNFTIHKWFFKDVFDASGVNLEVEIIEEDNEEDNKIEKIRKVVCDSDLIDRNHFVIEYLAELKYKINEIIDKLNKGE